MEKESVDRASVLGSSTSHCPPICALSYFRSRCPSHSLKESPAESLSLLLFTRCQLEHLSTSITTGLDETPLLISTHLEKGGETKLHTWKESF
ncbi:hypothetical protein ACLB2K_071146 [Fragaria x ananassa]